MAEPRPRAAWVLACALIAGCIQSGSVTCVDGSICPDTEVCVRVTNPEARLCAERDQLAQCAGRATYEHCGTNGRCYDGVCLPVSCGNGRIDRADPRDPADTGEMCDDGNERSGDGCASDCRSNETCGNDVIDPIVLERCDDGDRRSNDGCDSRCELESARWQELAIAPAEQTGAAVAYDIARDRAVMFGGAHLDDAPHDETWEWTGTAWSRVHPPQSPAPRDRAAMAYDARRRRVVMFGGNGVGGFDDTWEWDGTTWTPRLVFESPRARIGHAMVYDLRRGRVVLFGGTLVENVAHPSNDTWEWDGATWTELAPATIPPAKTGHAMAYDPSRGVTVMFGGREPPDHSVYEYDGLDWRSVTPTGPGPEPRTDAAMAYDPSTRRVLLVGRLDAAAPPVQDAWSWNGQRWESVAAPDPAARAGHVLVTDSRRGRVEMFGASVDGVASTWFWQGGTWTQSISQPRGNPRRMVLDPVRGRIVGVFEGDAPGVSEFDGASWSAPVSVAGPSPRVDTEIAYDAARQCTVLFGGQSDHLSMDDTWTWNGDRWTEHTPAARPPPLADHAMAFDSARSRVVLFGGMSCRASGCELSADTWTWDGEQWHAMAPAHHPPAREAAGFAYDPIHQTILLFGGGGTTAKQPPGGVAPLDDTWLWTGSDWIEQHPGPHPSARVGTAIAWDASRKRLVLFGGSTLAANVNDVWEWDGASWTPQAIANPPRRALHALASNVGAGIVLFGGEVDPGFPVPATHRLRWDGATAIEACRSDIDGDGDGLAGCADPDCWWACNPLCPPGAPCDPDAPHCGDGVCNAALENCQICADCSCDAICGDASCDPGETATSCPGDCVDQ